MHRVFIDGQAGTTGLDITRRLAGRNDLELLPLTDADRKDPAARARRIAQADVVIACLPDDAARETAALAARAGTRMIDASTAHRTDPGWVYGLPELGPGQRDAIAGAPRVANPGCYPTGFLLLVAPLVRAGLIAPGAALKVHALSGYSGGGRALIERHEAVADPGAVAARPYALGLDHKHLPEMRAHAGLDRAPIFCPAVGHYRQGMLVEVPLFADELVAPDRAEASPTRWITSVWERAYGSEPLVHLPDPETRTEAGFLSPQALNGTNRVELMVFGGPERLLLVARLDNLGKGAAGAAVQNLNLMLGLPERRGLEDPPETSA